MLPFSRSAWDKPGNAYASQWFQVRFSGCKQLVVGWHCRLFFLISKFSDNDGVADFMDFPWVYEISTILYALRLQWLGSRVVSVLDSGAVGPEFKSQSRRCRVTVLGKLFTPIVPLFAKQRNW